jgi:predicted dehydrogenase/nucleoside-diphosphate-sugar epimerase
LAIKRDVQPIRVGLLGTGYIADWHAKALRSIPAVSLEAVCDKNKPRAQAFGQRYGVSRCYESLDAMLKDVELNLDVVHVLLPPDFHARAASTLIEHGVNVFLEKPMSTTVGECSELIERAITRELSVGVNHNFLFAPVYERLRNDLRSGKLGQPDQVTIAWNRGLDELQSGPFNLWMLRDPRNIILEIGPHCLAFMLDLVGDLEIIGVQTCNPITLPGGQDFYRRWSVEAGAGPVGVTLSLSFSPGFTEQFIRIRGSLASATVDFERNTYLLHHHSRYGLDFDRYRMITCEATSLIAQARGSLRDYGLSKLKLSSKGNPYGLSIARALQSFYAGLGKTLDDRLSPELGRDVTSLCIAIGQEGVGEQLASRSTRHLQPLATSSESVSPAGILILGVTGFIGQELARQLLATGRRIRVLVRNPGRLPEDLQSPSVDILTGDLTRADDLLKAIDGCRVVYHLARANVKTWDEFVKQDIEITRHIANTCLSARIQRLIYTGTIDSYYAGAYAGMITEVTPLDPRIAWRNLYARAKAVSEGILLAMHSEQALPVTIFRPGIVIGRGGSPFHWGIGMWSWNAVCQIWGQGRNPLPLVLVEDVAQALVCALDVPQINGESFNLVADTDITALDYLKALEDYAGVSFQKIPTPIWKFYATDIVKWIVKKIVRHPDQRKPSYRDWETRTQQARYDCSKARNLLNWRPVCDRDEIIRRGIQLPASEFLPPPGGFKIHGQGAVQNHPL